MTLKKGMTGEAVRQLQDALKKYDSYMFGSVVVDGVFGTGTENAIKLFQQMKGLTPDGVAGAQTLSALGSALGIVLASTVTSPTSSTTKSVSTVASGSLLSSIPKPVLYGVAGFVAVGAVAFFIRQRSL